MKILNLHGFMGEADNKNYKALCAIIPAEDIVSPQLHYKEKSPVGILNQLSDMVISDDFIFVGQSLGGWYADKLSRKFSRPCILTNPCYYPHKLEIIADSGISEVFLKQYIELSSQDKNKRAYTICSNADTIIPENYADCVKLSKQITRVHGSHSTINNIEDYFVALLRQL